MARAYINRLKPDNTQELITINLNDLMEGDEQANPVLQREDRIIISSIFDLREEYTVAISGQVRRPGQFPYVRSEEHTSELQSLMRISYAVFGLKNKHNTHANDKRIPQQIRQ